MTDPADRLAALRIAREIVAASAVGSLDAMLADAAARRLAAATTDILRPLSDRRARRTLRVLTDEGTTFAVRIQAAKAAVLMGMGEE